MACDASVEYFASRVRSRLLSLVLAALGAAPFVACDEAPDDARQDEIAGVIAEADSAVIRARPALSAGKYVRMSTTPFEFLRGSLALYRHDARSGASQLSVSRFALDVPLVPSIGDPTSRISASLRASDELARHRAQRLRCRRPRSVSLGPAAPRRVDGARRAHRERGRRRRARRLGRGRARHRSRDGERLSSGDRARRIRRVARARDAGYGPQNADPRRRVHALRPRRGHPSRPHGLHGPHGQRFVG